MKKKRKPTKKKKTKNNWLELGFKRSMESAQLRRSYLEFVRFCLLERIPNRKHQITLSEVSSSGWRRLMGYTSDKRQYGSEDETDWQLEKSPGALVFTCRCTRTSNFEKSRSISIKIRPSETNRAPFTRARKFLPPSPVGKFITIFTFGKDHWTSLKARLPAQ